MLRNAMLTLGSLVPLNVQKVRQSLFSLMMLCVSLGLVVPLEAQNSVAHPTPISWEPRESASFQSQAK